MFEDDRRTVEQQERMRVVFSRLLDNARDGLAAAKLFGNEDLMERLENTISSLDDAIKEIDRWLDGHRS